MNRPQIAGHYAPVLLALFAVGVCHAQDTPNAGAPSITVSTRIVVLDVVVTDKKGNIVNGLKKENFKVYEDAVPQPVRYFEVPEQHRISPDITVNSTAELQKKAPDAPVTVLVMDEMNTRFEDMAFARYSVKQYVNAQHKKMTTPTELIAINTSKFEVLRDYTQDGDSILDSLNKHLTLYPWNLINDRTSEGTLQRLAVSLGALEQVAQATKGHPGRKNLIWIGHGFPGISTTDLPQEQVNGITGAVQKALNMLRDARITLYTIDPTAVSTAVVDIADPSNLDISEDANGEDPFASDVSFTTLAPATGGRAFFSRNDVDAEIGTSVRDGANFYTLTYSPTNKSTAAATYRRIRVVVDQPGLTATTRNGYYGSDAVVQPVSAHNQLAFDVNSAASTTMAYTGVAVTVTRVAGSPDSFTLHIDPRGLAFQDTAQGTPAANIVVEAVSFGAKNKFLGKTTDGLTLGLKSMADLAVPDASVSVTAKANLAPGTQRVRFVVRDSGNGRIGTADYTMP